MKQSLQLQLDGGQLDGNLATCNFNSPSIRSGRPVAQISFFEKKESFGYINQAVDRSLFWKTHGFGWTKKPNCNCSFSHTKGSPKYDN